MQKVLRRRTSEMLFSAEKNLEDAGTALIAEVNEIVMNLDKKYPDDFGAGRPACLNSVCDRLQVIINSQPDSAPTSVSASASAQATSFSSPPVAAPATAPVSYM